MEDGVSRGHGRRSHRMELLGFGPRRWLLALCGALLLGLSPIMAAGAEEDGEVSSPAPITPDPPPALAHSSGIPVPPELLADPPVTRDVLQHVRGTRDGQPGAGGIVALVPVPPSAPDLEGPLQVEYTLDPGLTRQVFEVLGRHDARLANVVLLDPATGRVLAYASTDPVRFPPTRIYPAASLIKVVTAAAALHHSRSQAAAPCRFVGSPYYLTPRLVEPQSKGHVTSLEGALAKSNNQCFAQLAVNAVGSDNMVDAIRRFGFLTAPAPGHAAGAVDAGSDRYDLGKLGCGLYGCWITPMHAARMAMTLAHGKQLEPYWIERVTDAGGRELELPPRQRPKQVLTPQLAAELREMMIETTTSGTARRSFTDAGGTPALGPVQVSGKTGTLSGSDPQGLYEWFAGVAPADDPKLAIAVVSVAANGHRVRATRIASEVLERVFCGGGGCNADAAQAFLRNHAHPVSTAPPEDTAPGG